MNLQHMARALGGSQSGRNSIAFPTPGHSPHDRGSIVTFHPDAPDGFVVFSHNGGNVFVIRDMIKALLGISRQVAAKPAERILAQVEPKPDDAERSRYALKIFDQGRDIAGTPGMTYLIDRGIDRERLPGDVGRALRWHRECRWEGSTTGAIIALLTDAITGEPRAIHRTAVTHAGEKIGKKMLGPAAGCVVRLWPDEAVTTGLVLGEGIETTLVAATRIEHKATRLAPAWAACSAGTMERFPPLTGIECLTLLVDNDANGAGQRAAAKCSARWTDAGREVVRLVPNAIGVDFADLAVAA